MGSRTTTTFHCDACGEELPKRTDGMDVSFENKVRFVFAIDEAVGPRYRLGFEMLCHRCLEGLIEVMKDFEADAKARRL